MDGITRLQFLFYCKKRHEGCFLFGYNWIFLQRYRLSSLFLFRAFRYEHFTEHYGWNPADGEIPFQLPTQGSVIQKNNEKGVDVQDITMEKPVSFLKYIQISFQHDS